MTMHQQTRLSDHAAVGAPGPLPYCVENWHDAELADLDAMKLDPQFGLAGMGLWPVVVAVPSFDAARQALAEGVSGLAVDAPNRRWTATQSLRDLSAAELVSARSALVAYAATARYARETGGINVAGAPIATDRDSQALITGAYSYVLAKPDATIVFKSTSGFISLTADQIQAIALAVGAHVQACFAAEGQIDADIQAGKVTTAAQVDAALAAVA